MNYETAIKKILDLTDGDAKAHDKAVLEHIAANAPKSAQAIAADLLTNDFSAVNLEKRISYIWAASEGDLLINTGFTKRQVIEFAKALVIAFDNLPKEETKELPPEQATKAPAGMRHAEPQDFAEGVTLQCRFHGHKFNITDQYAEGIWNTRQGKVVFESEAQLYWTNDIDHGHQTKWACKHNIDTMKAKKGQVCVMPISYMVAGELHYRVVEARITLERESTMREALILLEQNAISLFKEMGLEFPQLYVRDLDITAWNFELIFQVTR